MRFVRFLFLATGTVLLLAAAPDSWRKLPTQQGVWRGIPIQYKVQDGWAVVEGDILLGRADEMAIAPSKPGTVRGASVISAGFRLWPNATIVYRIDPDLPYQERVRDAIRHWEERTPVRFVERNNEPDWVTFRPGSGCSSSVGDRGGEQFVTLSYGCDTDATIHEIGHAVGLFHTQSRIDRDRWIRVRYEDIDKDYRSQYDQHITDGRDVGPYPYNSVMHYSPYGFSREDRMVMVSVPPGIPLGQDGGLTAMDIEVVHQIYKVPLNKVIISSTPPGLKVEVDQQEYQTPVEFGWQNGESHQVRALPVQSKREGDGKRYEFLGWSDAGEIDHTITVSEDRKVFDARFRQLVEFKPQVTTLEGAGGGRVVITPESADGYYPLGTRVRVRAQADEGNTFLSWCGDDLEGDLPWAVLLNGCGAQEHEVEMEWPGIEMVARFTPAPVTTVTTNPPGLWIIVDGDIYVAPQRFAWDPGSEHKIAALSRDTSYDGCARYEFVTWGEGESTALTVTAEAEPRTLTAEYKTRHELSLSYAWYIRSGSTRPDLVPYQLSVPEEDGWLPAGTDIEITPPVNDNWRLVNWALDGTGAQVPLKLKLTDYTVVLMNFLSTSWLNASAIVHDAKGQPDVVAPGQRLRIHWVGNAPVEPLEAPAGEPLPTSLGDVEVHINRQPAQLLRASKDEVVCIVPEAAMNEQRSAEIGITVGRNGTLFVNLAVLKTNPGIYTVNGTGRGAANDQPVGRGEEFELKATGLHPDEPVEVVVGESSVTGTATPDEAQPGVWRVRARIPDDSAGGSLRLQVVNGGKASQAGVTINVLD